MEVQTKRVTGRRKVSFTSFQEILDDVHALAKQPTRQLGNWTLGEICEHLASAMDMAIDGSAVPAPWYLRMAGPLFKKRLLRQMTPGFRVPKNATFLMPNSSDSARGIALLEKAAARLQNTPSRTRHFILGPMTRDEWDQLQFRHCELHLSFIVPQ